MMGLWSWVTEWRGYILLCIRTTACPLQWTATFKQDLEWLLPGTREGGLQRLECQQYLSPTVGGGRGSSEVACVRSPSFLPTPQGCPTRGFSFGMECGPYPKAGTGNLMGLPQLGCRSEGAKPQTHIFLPTTCQSSPGSEAPGGVLEKLQKEGWASATSPMSLASCKVGFYAAFLNVKPEVGISLRGWCYMSGTASSPSLVYFSAPVSDLLAL